MKLSEKLEKGEKITVGVFMGGASSEREISLESGRHIYNSLDVEKYERVPIFVDPELRFWKMNETLLWMNTTADIVKELKTQGAEQIKYQDLKDEIEFAFLGLHGKLVEDGSLQGLLELQEIPYNGPGVLGSALGMDKFYQRKVLMGAGFNVPKHQAVYAVDWEDNKDAVMDDIDKEFDYPVIIKPSREGCSTAIMKAKDRKDLEAGIEDALNWDNLVLVEEFIDAMEITCTIIGNEDPVALTPTETPSQGDFLTVEEKFLPGDASMITPPTGMDESTVEKVKEQFVKVYKALELSVYSRIDAFWKDGKLIILEPNTLPGVTPSTMVFHQAAEEGMNSSDFFDKVIGLSIEDFEKKVGPR